MRTLGWSLAGGATVARGLRVVIGVGTVVGSLALAGGSLGCSSSDDDDGGAGAGGSGGTGAGAGGSGGSGQTCGTATFIPAGCQSCLEGGCCTQLVACDADCLEWFECANDCAGEPGCKGECDQDVPAGADAAANLDACVAASCDTECGGGVPNPNAICDSGFSLANDPDCASCLSESCCDAYESCADDESCYGCLTGDEPAACGDTTLDEAVGDCTFQACDAVCD